MRKCATCCSVLLIVLAVKMLVFYVVGIEHGWWRFSGLSDLVKLFIANVAGSVVFTAATVSILGAQFPRSVYLIDFLLCFLATAGARFGVRLYHEMVMHEVASKTTQKGLLIYGAGVAGLNLVREIRSNPSLNYRIIGFLDDNPHKRNASLMGVGVLGSGRDVTRIVERYRRRSHQHRRNRDCHAVRLRQADVGGSGELPRERRAVQDDSRTLPNCWRAKCASAKSAKSRWKTCWAANPCNSSTTGFTIPLPGARSW